MTDTIRFDSIDDQIEHILLENRRIFLSSALDSRVAEEVIRKLWYLEYQAPGKPITFVINSPGGSTDAGFALWDQIRMITSPMTTLVTGVAASMGSILSLAAAEGRRFSTPHCRIMIHQPAIHGDLRGDAADLAIHAKEILNTRSKLVSIYVQATGKDEKTIEKAIDRDTWMSPEEATDYGLLDGIVESYEDLK